MEQTTAEGYIVGEDSGAGYFLAGIQAGLALADGFWDIRFGFGCSHG
jgi:hypothetical protein